MRIEITKENGETRRVIETKKATLVQPDGYNLMIEWHKPHNDRLVEYAENIYKTDDVTIELEDDLDA